MEKENSTKKAIEKRFIFEKQNYVLMATSVAVIILGFIMMSGTENIYNTMKITIAPLIVLIGFVIGVVAIMKKPQNNS